MRAAVRRAITAAPPLHRHAWQRVRALGVLGAALRVHCGAYVTVACSCMSHTALTPAGNKLAALGGFDALAKLKKLTVEGNQLASLAGLGALPALTELSAVRELTCSASLSLSCGCGPHASTCHVLTSAFACVHRTTTRLPVWKAWTA